jgi:hypothetical protein
MRESSNKLKPSLLLLANNDLTARFKLIYDYTINNENFEKLSPLVEDFTNWFPQLCNELRIELTRMK